MVVTHNHPRDRLVDLWPKQILLKYQGGALWCSLIELVGFCNQPNANKLICNSNNNLGLSRLTRPAVLLPVCWAWATESQSFGFCGELFLRFGRAVISSQTARPAWVITRPLMGRYKSLRPYNQLNKLHFRPAVPSYAFHRVITR